MHTDQHPTTQEDSWQRALEDLSAELTRAAQKVSPRPPEHSPVNRAVHRFQGPSRAARPRLEYKYLVPNAALTRLRGMIAPFVEVDPHAAPYGTRGYTVRSIYFDTHALDFYHEKLAGVKKRKKLRLRGYNGGQESNIVFLEIKRKHTLAVTKNRSPVVYAHVGALFGTGDVARYVHTQTDFPGAQEDARCFFFFFYRDALRPVVLIAYEREAYTAKFDPSVRITFDKNLRSAIGPGLDALFGEGEMRPIMGQHFVLEVKCSGRFPGWLQRVISLLDVRQQSLSKYTIGLDAHPAPGRAFHRSAALAWRRSF